MFKLLLVLSDSGPVLSLSQACEELRKEYPGTVEFDIMPASKLGMGMEAVGDICARAEKSDFVLLMDSGTIQPIMGVREVAAHLKGVKPLLPITRNEDEDRALCLMLDIPYEHCREAVCYLRAGGMKNFRNLLLYMASVFGGAGLFYEKPELTCHEGIYYPENMNAEGLLERVREERMLGKRVVGILFPPAYYREANTRHIDALVDRIIKYGAFPVAVYTSTAPNRDWGSRGLEWTVDNIFMPGGEPAVDVLINTIPNRQSSSTNPFLRLGVPVLHAMAVYRPIGEWDESIIGLDASELVCGVFDPEFDGQIITAPVTGKEQINDSCGSRPVLVPIEERVDKVVRLALNWAKLRYIPAENKKVAVIFHNMPPRNDSIGSAFGLDTPASVFNIIEALKADGVRLDYDFSGGAEIIQKIIDTVSNDTRWLSEEEVVRRSSTSIDAGLYEAWFEGLDGRARAELLEQWESPPGSFMVYEGKFPVPGIRNGNVFIGLQPARGYGEKMEEIYHSPYIVPPHYYIAYYRWIKKVFGADVIIHVGTHGTLEWLPGKQAGVSARCFPDICIDDMPHLYPYIINIPGEGMQVKRRSHGVLIGHLIPSMQRSGTYDEMERLDSLIKQYYQAKQTGAGAIKHIAGEIITLAEAGDFHRDIGEVPSSRSGKELEDWFDRLHVWIEELKRSMVRDGLHIFGEVPEKERFLNLVKQLVRVANGDTPSLPECIAEIKGYSYKEISSKDFKRLEDGRTSLMLLEEIDSCCDTVLERLWECDFDGKKAREVFALFPEYSPEAYTRMAKTIDFVCGTVVPSLRMTTDEIKYLLEGVRGNFVPPGKSGSPTRGRADILPTGRNFFAIDPNAIPTRAAWETGIKLGEALLERYLQDEGKYPESIAMIVYSTSTMKTFGEDIAESFYLMGLRPVWLEGSDKVVGIEVIPEEKLGRPRIDVVWRITGLFRDTFPNLVYLMNDAVSMVASLEEDTGTNYVRKHLMDEIGDLTGRGFSLEKARDEASLRVFGCPPGTYGAGVNKVIHNGNWESVKDIAKVYGTWGAHAYGRKIHGEVMREAFELRLSKVEATVKNEVSVEIDMLDSDDFFSYHGGIAAAVEVASGKKPRVYCGNSADAERVSLRSAKEETARVMRSRILNPKWFEGLKKHGYKGAQEISRMVDVVFGWDATAQVAEDWMYDRISEVYLFDREKRDWMQSVNPWAVHNMAERLLEANQRGMWNAGQDTLEKLREVYLNIEGNIEEKL